MDKINPTNQLNCCYFEISNMFTPINEVNDFKCMYRLTRKNNLHFITEHGSFEATEP